MCKISLTCGAVERTDWNTNGKTIGEVRASAKSFFGIGDSDVAYLNGAAVPEGTEVKDNDKLVFRKETGSKGR